MNFFKSMVNLLIGVTVGALLVGYFSNLTSVSHQPIASAPATMTLTPTVVYTTQTTKPTVNIAGTVMAKATIAKSMQDINGSNVRVSTPTPKLTAKDFASVSVVGKHSDTEKCRICYRVNLAFMAQNNSAFDIKAIKGVLTIYDAFKNPIMKVNVKLTDKILYAYKTDNWNNLGFTANEYKEEEMEIYNTSFEYLEFNFLITEILLTDGTIKKFH
jgi:hypothetical protein